VNQINHKSENQDSLNLEGREGGEQAMSAEYDKQHKWDNKKIRKGGRQQKTVDILQEQGGRNASMNRSRRDCDILEHEQRSVMTVPRRRDVSHCKKDTG
jgi:hypothetical protein